MTKAFLIDLAHCNGCYSCQIVCKDEHCQKDWEPYSAAQPLTGQFWLKVDEKDRGQVPWVRVAYTPTLCAHCADAPCASVCADGAFERRDDGLLLINPKICTGCGLCVDACPQRSIYFNNDLHIAQKCTGCAHLLDNGWEKPRCADACPHEVIQFKEEEEFGDLLHKAEALEAVSSLGPKVYYLNLPKRFVAGSTIDFGIDEVVIGATVRAVGSRGYEATCTTDDLGDFMFDEIPPDTYSISITADGYKNLIVEADLTKEDYSLGDLSLVAL